MSLPIQPWLRSNPTHPPGRAPAAEAPVFDWLRRAFAPPERPPPPFTHSEHRALDRLAAERADAEVRLAIIQTELASLRAARALIVRRPPRGQG